MDAETIREIRNMSYPAIFEDNGETYIVLIDGSVHPFICPAVTPETVTLHSLDALIKMVENEAMELNHCGKIFIKTNSPTNVEAFTAPEAEQRDYRHKLYSVSATDIPGWEPMVSLGYEEAIVAIRTRFQPSDDTDYMLKLLSEISNGAKVTLNDNGIATTVVTQKGVALQSGVAIRPIVSLRPYRSFQELDQPEGQFLIRVSERAISFVEADGGMWKLTARQSIVEYLQSRLKGYIETGSVVVML